MYESSGTYGIITADAATHTMTPAINASKAGRETGVLEPVNRILLQKGRVSISTYVIISLHVLQPPNAHDYTSGVR